jgi:Zn-finger nucleic acid-binding protein
MKCPHCPESTLVMAERQGVEIDYCPQCRGVWLDRGELDKILERAASVNPAPAPAPAAARAPAPSRPDFVDSDSPYQRHGHYKRKSWLSDIFD